MKSPVICRYFLMLAIGLFIAVACKKAEDSGANLQPAPASSDDEGEGEGRGGWFYTQRAYPLKTIPAEARMNSLRQLDREEARLKRLRSTGRVASNDPSTFLPAWVAIGPKPIDGGQTYGFPRTSVSGRVSIIVPDPGYNGGSNQTIYIGAAQGGVWRSRDNGSTWTPLTDNQPSLSMGAIAIDSSNPSVIYAGTGEGHLSGDSYYGAGLLKSIDGGATWTQITGPISTTAPARPSFLGASFTALAIDRISPATVFAATQYAITGSATGSVEVTPLGDRGVWKSTDGGASWRNVNPLNASRLTQSACDVLIDPLNQNRVFAAMLGRGIYRSNAGGEPGTWEALINGLPSTDIYRIKLAAGPPISPSTSSTLYAAIGNGSNYRLLGVYKSTDGGATWIQGATPAPTISSTYYAMALSVDPADANVVYYGTLGTTGAIGTVWRSRNGGASWSDISSGVSGGLHVDTHWIVPSPVNSNTLFTANDGGVWRTDNALADQINWVNLNQNLSITQFQSIALHPADAEYLMGGTQDNGTNIYRANPVWLHARDGDGGAVIVDQSNPSIVYHTYFNRSNSGGTTPQMGPEISFDGGSIWQRRGCFNCVAQIGNFNPADRVAFYAPLAQNTGFAGENGNVIYFGTHRLYRSADRGVTWTGLGASADGYGADLTKNLNLSSDGFPSFITAIAAHPSLDQSSNPPGEVVWVGTGDGFVQVTSNAAALGGATFSNLTKAPLPNRFVTDIALDSGSRRKAIVTYSGFDISTPETPGHIFMTLDQGSTWTNISGNLPDTPVNTAVIDPQIPGTIFIGTDIGVFHTLDQGLSWNKLSEGMPNVAVIAMEYHAASRSIVAATHGRGVFRLSLPRAAANVSAASFLGPSLSGEAIVAAFGADLSTATEPANVRPLPFELAGTRVTVKDSAGVERSAPLFFVSPSQVNYLMPQGVAGGFATVTITNANGIASIGSAGIAAVAPGIFAANANGQGVAAAVAVRVKPDGSQIYEPINVFDSNQKKFVSLPIDLGPENETVILVLFGTGIRGRSSEAAIKARIGGLDAQILYASISPEFIGLDQVNLVIPKSLTGKGEVNVALEAEGLPANVVTINVK